MTEPVPFPNETSPLSRYLGPRHHTEAESKAAWAAVAERDMTAQRYTARDLDAAVELIASMCGMTVSECLKPTRKSLRSAARLLLDTITLGQAELTAAAFLSEPKNKQWWKANGKPTGAANTIITEYSRAKSQDRQTIDYTEYLQPPVVNETPEQLAAAAKWAASWTE